jgi:AcrR family transcriptional regulator
MDTKEKIKKAARKLFKEKGFSATTMRDIAAEASVNSALTNYHFQTKENLFSEIMKDIIITFRTGLEVVLNDEKTTINEKIRKIVDNYMDMLEEEPLLPLFMFSEIQKSSLFITEILKPHELFINTNFESQIKEKGLSDENLAHLFINILALIVGPFVGQSILSQIYTNEPNQWRQILQSRREMIPIWIEKMFNI